MHHDEPPYKIHGILTHNGDDRSFITNLWDASRLFLYAAHTESGDSRLSFNCSSERGWSERVIREALSELKTRVDSKLSVKRHVRHGKTNETESEVNESAEEALKNFKTCWAGVEVMFDYKTLSALKFHFKFMSWGVMDGVVQPERALRQFHIEFIQRKLVTHTLNSPQSIFPLFHEHSPVNWVTSRYMSWISRLT